MKGEWAMIGVMWLIATVVMTRWSLLAHSEHHGYYWFIASVRTISLLAALVFYQVGQLWYAIATGVFFIMTLVDDGQEPLIWSMLVEAKRRQRRR